MGEGDLAGQDGVVAGDVGRWVAAPVLQFHVQPHVKLLHVESAPVDVESVAHLLGLFSGELLDSGYALSYSAL